MATLEDFAPIADDPRTVLHASLVLISTHHGPAVALAASQAAACLSRAIGSAERADLETAVALELDAEEDGLERIRMAVDALVALNVVRCEGGGLVRLNESLANSLVAGAAR